MVVPLGGMGMQEEAGAPPCVKDRFSKWWWCLMGLLIVVMIGRFVAVDIFGGLLSGIMAVIVWYMVTNDCAKMSQYCVLLFGFLCLMNTILEFVTLASCLAGRQTSSTTSVPSTDGLSTSYTVTIEKHPFFDGSAGWYYNVQSAVMIACPVAAFCGAALAYLSYNAFPTSLFADDGPDGGGEAQNFGVYTYVGTVDEVRLRWREQDSSTLRLQLSNHAVSCLTLVVLMLMKALERTLASERHGAAAERPRMERLHEETQQRHLALQRENDQLQRDLVRLESTEGAVESDMRSKEQERLCHDTSSRTVAGVRSSAPSSGTTKWLSPEECRAMSLPLDATLNKYSLEYQYAELSEATGNFAADLKLGSGSFGTVFRGVQRDGTDIAVKVLNMSETSGFNEEVKVLSKFRHPNLVILMGFGRCASKRFLVYEFLGGGDVFRRLQKCSLEGLCFSWDQRLSVAFDAACGLSHLHNSSPKVFHRDIKSANILLDRHGNAKMADFGLACLSHFPSQRVVETMGTIGYVDPLYVQSGVITEGSEVYSFGMVLLELLIAKPPASKVKKYDGGRGYTFLSSQIQNSIPNAISMADPNAKWPVRVSGFIADLAFACSEDRQESRPNFRSIVNMLRSFKDSLAAASSPPLPPAAFAPRVLDTTPRGDMSICNRSPMGGARVAPPDWGTRPDWVPGPSPMHFSLTGESGDSVPGLSGDGI